MEAILQMAFSVAFSREKIDFVENFNEIFSRRVQSTMVHQLFM